MNYQPNIPFGFFPPPVIKRKAFFSFHYDDIMRVNNARMTGTLKNPAASAMRTFYDGSLWESRKLHGPEALKQLIRDGVKQTSAVCVLIGTHTWGRPWVRYEIARAVIDNRGLLGVHLNSINHHQRRCPCPLGPSPFDYLGVGKVSPPGFYQPPVYYLFVRNGLYWQRYQDYTQPVSLPPYLPDCAAGAVTPLSYAVRVYDFMADSGPQNLGSWIDRAALAVGR
jgi:hypothetical protein